MSRAAFFDAIVNDSELNLLGINDETVFHNWSSEEKPVQTGPFIILRWEDEGGPIWGSEPERGPRDLTLWAHQPMEVTTDFNRVTRLLNRIDKVVTPLRDVAGSDGYTLSFVRLGGRSGDLVDTGFNTLTRNASYNIYQVEN